MCPSVGVTARTRGSWQVAEFDRVLSDNAFEFGLLGNAFVGFIHALDAIQRFVALGWKQLRDFIRAAPSRLASEAGSIVDRLADPEPMIAQMTLRAAPTPMTHFTTKIEAGLNSH